MFKISNYYGKPGSLLSSQRPAIGPYPDPILNISTMYLFTSKFYMFLPTLFLCIFYSSLREISGVGNQQPMETFEGNKAPQVFPRLYRYLFILFVPPTGNVGLLVIGKYRVRISAEDRITSPIPSCISSDSKN
jgi:hypothetical protein